MLKKDKYSMGFDASGLLIFLLIMIPNFIWFSIPAPNDILQNDSITPTLDTIASIFQIIMLVALCTVVNSEGQKPITISLRIGIMVATLVYFSGWIFYYQGIINSLTIMVLCISPCISFLLFAIARKNIIAITSAIIFMICHVMYGILNFVLLT